MAFHTSITRAAICISLAGLVSACDRAPAPQGEPQTNPTAAAPAPVAAPEPAAPTEFGETLLWIDALKACGGGQVTTIHWSKEAVAKGPASIELGDENPGVFARIGGEGQKETGPWAYPGGAVLLRGDDGEVRARQIFKGPENCPAA